MNDEITLGAKPLWPCFILHPSSFFLRSVAAVPPNFTARLAATTSLNHQLPTLNLPLPLRLEQRQIIGRIHLHDLGGNQTRARDQTNLRRALAESANQRKSQENTLTPAPAGRKSLEMNPTQKQFSLNRAASKGKFLSVEK